MWYRDKGKITARESPVLHTTAACLMKPIVHKIGPINAQPMRLLDTTASEFVVNDQ